MKTAPTDVTLKERTQINHTFNGVVGYVKVQLNICHYDNVADIYNMKIIIITVTQNKTKLR